MVSCLDIDECALPHMHNCTGKNFMGYSGLSGHGRGVQLISAPCMRVASGEEAPENFFDL